jgi:hypothetical protein
MNCVSPTPVCPCSARMSQKTFMTSFVSWSCSARLFVWQYRSASTRSAETRPGRTRVESRRGRRCRSHASAGPGYEVCDGFAPRRKRRRPRHSAARQEQPPLARRLLSGGGFELGLQRNRDGCGGGVGQVAQEASARQPAHRLDPRGQLHRSICPPPPHHAPAPEPHHPPTAFSLCGPAVGKAVMAPHGPCPSLPTIACSGPEPALPAADSMARCHRLTTCPAYDQWAVGPCGRQCPLARLAHVQGPGS